MPAYQCGECGEVFRRKAALAEHREDCTSGTNDTVFDDLMDYVSGININLSPRNIWRTMSLQRAGLLFGVLMMGTLFLGTASFMMNTAPATSSPTGAVTAESNPALGYSISSAKDLPHLSRGNQPQLVSSKPLSIKQQLWTITQGGKNGIPAAIIQYNCDTSCPGLVNNLTRLANTYSGWVYVAPNPHISATVAITGYQFIHRYDAFDPQSMHTAVCGYYQQLGLSASGPIACATG